MFCLLHQTISLVDRQNVGIGIILDDLDQKLLIALRKDARASTVALARVIGLSRSATQARIDRLLKSFVITGFTTVESPRAAITSHFLIKLKAGFKCAQVVPKLKSILGIVSIHSITGSNDILLRAEAPSLDGIETVRRYLADVLGIETVTTMIVLERHLN